MEPRPLPRVPGVTHRHVKAGGLRFHVAEAGEGDPVLLLHGWPQHWYVWRRVIPALASRYRVICPDLRGFGWSDAPPSGYEKEQLALDMLALMDALDLERVHLAGHDWGGFAGFLMCLEEPDRIRKFLALNIIHPWPSLVAAIPNLPRLLYQAVIAGPGGEWLLRNQTPLLRDLLQRTSVRPNTWTETELEQFMGQFREPARARASVELYRTFLLREVPAAALAPERGRLRVPTLLLFGVRDAAISPRMLSGFEGHADDMRVELVPETGHFIVDERPELVAARALALFG